jgi:tRNA(Ile)-lysidine synthase
MARKALGPATLAIVQAVRRYADRSLVTAVSGGADSLALAYAVGHVARERQLPYAAVTVDHNLQPGSADQAARVAEQLGLLGYHDVVVRQVDVNDTAAGPEGAARAARYTALEEEATRRDADIVLGHTLDDQAETVLLGLLRGSGTRSLAGMAVRSGRRLRPLLGIRRDQTRTACTELGLDVWDDPHNDDPRYLRSRIRRQLMPALAEQLGPGIPEALARTADLARADADLLDTLADQLYERSLSSPTGRPNPPPEDRPPSLSKDAGLSCSDLLDAPEALRTRVIKRWLTDNGATEVPYRHVRAVEALVTDWHGQREVQLSGIAVRRCDGLLVIC